MESADAHDAGSLPRPIVPPHYCLQTPTVLLRTSGIAGADEGAGKEAIITRGLGDIRVWYSWA